jgi:hypothetical protein
MQKLIIKLTMENRTTENLSPKRSTEMRRMACNGGMGRQSSNNVRFNKDLNQLIEDIPLSNPVMGADDYSLPSISIRNPGNGLGTGNTSN